MRSPRRTTLVTTFALVAACSGTADTTTTSAGETSTTAANTPTTAEPTTSMAAEPGSLVVYSGRNEAFVQPVIDQFEAETGIEVRVRYGGTGDLATTIVAEGERSPADIFWAQDPAFIGGLAKQGLLAELPADILSLVPPRFSDGAGHWVGITGRSRVLVYNVESLGDDQIPDSVWDLIDPSWRGRVGIAPTNGSFIAFVTAMILVEGEDRTREWLNGIAANDAVIFDGNGPIVDAVIAGDIDAGLVNHYYLLQRQGQLGAETARNHFLASGDSGGLVLATGAGVLMSAANPEQAVQFIRYLLGAEAQAHFLSLFEYPLVEGIGEPEGQPPLEELPTLDIDLSDTADTLDTALTLIAEAGLT
jgi:iron(III) transport system substrate-binding protein